MMDPKGLVRKDLAPYPATISVKYQFKLSVSLQTHPNHSGFTIG